MVGPSAKLVGVQNLHPILPERRKRRSTDPLTALHYQLALARREGAFDALVLADSAGCVVAGAGAWPTCEMLAAYAPLLAAPPTDGGLTAELEVLAQAVQVRGFSVEGAQVLLCGRGGGPEGADMLARAASGCTRILATNRAA